MIRRAETGDLDAVERIYNELHDAEERGDITVGWKRDIYPARSTAEDAIKRNDLFVLEDDGDVLGAGIINNIQVDVYHGAPWGHEAEDDKICVLHTLVISPRAGRKGLGRQFVNFYEEYARVHGCHELRLDTNEKNTIARKMYRKLGYKEISIAPTVFNGIEGVNLVLLEKWIS